MLSGQYTLTVTCRKPLRREVSIDLSSMSRSFRRVELLTSVEMSSDNNRGFIVWLLADACFRVNFRRQVDGRISNCCLSCYYTKLTCLIVLYCKEIVSSNTFYRRNNQQQQLANEVIPSNQQQISDDPKSPPYGLVLIPLVAKIRAFIRVIRYLLLQNVICQFQPLF